LGEDSNLKEATNPGNAPEDLLNRGEKNRERTSGEGMGTGGVSREALIGKKISREISS